VRILVLTNLYPPHAIGGYEERCRQTSDQLESRGHQIRILTSSHGQPPVPDDGRIARTLRIHGFFGHPWLPPHRLFGLERHNHAMLRQELASFRPDIVHVWNLGGLSKALILTLQEWGGPVAFDVSDHWIARSLRADVWLRWWNGEAGGVVARSLRAMLRGTGLDRWVRRQAPYAPWSRFTFPRIYFCSAALREITVQAGWPVQHGAVIYCGVETARFQPRPMSPRCDRLLYVGRLSDDKDPLTALRAVARVRAGGEPVTLDLYGGGEGEYRRQLEAEADKPELAGAVRFLSAKAEAMPAIYAAYDALLFTSAWEEPFALTPLEAMAASLPVIGTPSGGSRELFRDGENALVFPARDDAALATAIRRLRADPVLRNNLAQRSLGEVRAHYDLTPIVTQIEQFLEETRHGR
jgi:glycosyltransferase involved in cell wall biosynthesis